MRKFMNLVEATMLVYDRNGTPEVMYDENDVLKAIGRGEVDKNTHITVYGNTARPEMHRASEVPEIAKHFKSDFTPFQFIQHYNDGPPRTVSVINLSSLHSAINHRLLKLDTEVSFLVDGERVTKLARAVPFIKAMFDDQGVKPEPATPSRNAGGRIHITRLLEIIHTADIRTELGAEQVLKALHSLCDSVLAWVENRGEVALAARKAVGEARTYFPRDAQGLMSNVHALHNIRDGLQIIRDALKPYNVVMEAHASRPSHDPRRGERYSSWTKDGEAKPQEEIDDIAMEVMLKLTPEEIRAMTQMSDAVSVRTNWMVKISLGKWGLTSGSRSGDNAEPFTALGRAVHRLLGGKLNESVDLGQCEEQVMSKGLNFPRLQQCSRKAVKEEDGKKVCQQHSKEAGDARQTKREDAWRVRNAIRRAEHYARIKLKKKR